MRTIVSSRVVPVLLLVSAACTGAAPDGSDALDVTVRDSAGVRIVESHLPDGLASTYAELGEPDLEIGVVDGDPAYAFTRVVAARALPDVDGEILVVEGQSQELRIFDASGAHLRTFGGAGDGPGEFGYITNLAGIRGDTVFIWEGYNRRVTSFLVDGTVLGTFTPPFDRSVSPRSVVSLPGGSLLVEAMDMPEGGLGSMGEDAFQVPYVLRRVVSDGGIDTLAVLPGQHLRRGEPRRVTMPDGSTQNAVIFLAALIEYQAYMSPSGGQVWVGFNDRYSIERRSLSGDVDMVVRVPELERPLSGAVVDSIRQFRLEACRGNRAECERTVEATLEAFPVPDNRPAYSTFLVDAGGRLWVAEWAHPGAQVTGWHVFSTDGELLGRVAIPAGLRITDVQEGFVLGVIRNELNVPFVRRYPLTRRS